MIWVRRITSDTWHFCRNCRHWPKSPKGKVPWNKVVIDSGTKPTTGEFCDECLAKRKRGACQTTEDR